jgi:7,8-dihydropterin-6-yl-methyl-4-(beta-D-ribofuranosyl)aminobenzene 5'-phosphate synthase
MKVVVLIDKKSNPNLELLTEYGLSIYFEVDGYKWLFDLGASKLFAENASRLDVDIEDVDYLVLSHGHTDHAGGLHEFLRLNKKAQIFITSEIEEKLFFSKAPAFKRQIRINHFCLNHHKERFAIIDSNAMLSESVGFVTNITRTNETPKANQSCFQVDAEGEILDELNKAVALSIIRPDGLIVFSGCCHNGIRNVLEACASYCNATEIKVCIGGTHLLDSDIEKKYETDSEIQIIGKSLLSAYPKLHLITGHCTGENAQKVLSPIMGTRFTTFYSGAEYTV